MTPSPSQDKNGRGLDGILAELVDIPVEIVDQGAGVLEFKAAITAAIEEVPVGYHQEIDVDSFGDEGRTFCAVCGQYQYDSPFVCYCTKQQEAIDEYKRNLKEWMGVSDE